MQVEGTAMSKQRDAEGLMRRGDLLSLVQTKTIWLPDTKLT